MDRNNYVGLYTAYLQMYDESVSATRKGTAKGHIGQDQLQGAGRMGTAGSGRAFNLNPVTGLGRGYKGDKDKVAANYKKVKAQDKAKDRGISSSDRKERARQNKDNSSKRKLDNLLKDIRGK